MKYPSTLHLPWSPGLSRDDKQQGDLSALIGQDVVYTEKMDGENTTLRRDRCHARSLNSADHPGRHHVKALHAQIRHLIPKDWRVCGENLYAEHSIPYDNLSAYFQVFGIFTPTHALSWEDTEHHCQAWGLRTVPVLRQEIFTPASAQQLITEMDFERSEGYVVRPSAAFDLLEFPRCVLKYVRKNHVQTDSHWMHGPIKRNTLRK